jgi:hypothetical protein
MYVHLNVLDLAHSQEENKVDAIVIECFALLVLLGTAYHAMAQDAATPYANMAPIEQYLSERAGFRFAGRL